MSKAPEFQMYQLPRITEAIKQSGYFFSDLQRWTQICGCGENSATSAFLRLKSDKISFFPQAYRATIKGKITSK